jgi:predicted nuclease of predicted toxin-antitoxin system
MKLRFIVDAQLPIALAVWLREKGCDADHVAVLNMETARDSEIARLARKRSAIIITKDADFIGFSTEQTPPVLWVRLGNITRRQLIASFEQAWPGIIRAFEDGELLVELI